MKKIFLLLMIILTMSGCGSSAEDKTVKIGTLTQLNSTPEKAATVSGGEINFYDNFISMQMALSSKQVEKIQTYRSVAKYMTKVNPEFVVDDAQHTISLVDNFCCAVRSDDVALRDSFDAAIIQMKTDGTLGKLIDQFINKLMLPPTVFAIPTFNDAPTIKVGITGDLPPLDLILADGTPAGFNTAVLAEIGKRLHQNIQLVKIDSAARAVALTSEQVDVIFWVVVPQDDKRPKNFDVPEGVAVTAPYYQDAFDWVKVSDMNH